MNEKPNMSKLVRNLTPVWTLLVEGQNGIICDLLHRAGPGLRWAYDQWLETRIPLLEEEDEAAAGHIIVKSSQQLLEALTALLSETATKSLSPKVEIALWVEAGDPELGFSASLNRNSASGEWRVDGQTVAKELQSKMKQIAQISQEALIINALDEGTDKPNP